mgnify:CR=1 FL=1
MQQNRKEELSNDITIDYGFSLGSGAYGDVFRGMSKSRNCFVAIKRIKDEHSDATTMMQEEVDIMRKMIHENILNFLDIISTKSGMYLIMEYCEGGSLEK